MEGSGAEAVNTVRDTVVVVIEVVDVKVLSHRGWGAWVVFDTFFIGRAVWQAEGVVVVAIDIQVTRKDGEVSGQGGSERDGFLIGMMGGADDTGVRNGEGYAGRRGEGDAFESEKVTQAMNAKRAGQEGAVVIVIHPKVVCWIRDGDRDVGRRDGVIVRIRSNEADATGNQIIIKGVKVIEIIEDGIVVVIVVIEGDRGWDEQGDGG